MGWDVLFMFMYEIIHNKGKLLKKGMLKEYAKEVKFVS